MSPSPRIYLYAGGALLVAAVVVAIVLVTTLGSGGHARKAPSPAVPQSFSDPAIGLSGPLPADWVEISGPRFAELRSHDGTTVIFIFSPPGKSLTASQLVATELASVQAKYTGVRVSAGPYSALGGRPAKSRSVDALNVHRVPVGILVIGARGARRNYVLEAVLAQHGPAHDLSDTEQIVEGLQLIG